MNADAWKHLRSRDRLLFRSYAQSAPAAALCLVAILLVVLAGCSAQQPVRVYEGVELPPERVARLSGTTHYNVWIVYNRTTYVQIAAVDGYPATTRNQEWILLPGAHTVDSLYQVRRFFAAPYGGFGHFVHSPGRSRTQFVARAGRGYRVDSEEFIDTNGRKAHRSWVVDAESGEVVSHDAPADPSGETAEPAEDEDTSDGAEE